MNKYFETTQIAYCRDRQVLHEYFADRLIQAALVMGYRTDELFVAKLGALAWLNGAVAIADDSKSNETKDVARDFMQSTELGCSEFHVLGRAATGWTDPMFPVLTEIEGFYRRRRGARRLSVERGSDLPAIRQLLGEAALGGMLAREHYPFLFQILTTQKDYICGQEAFMIRILNDGILCRWSNTKHLLVELAEMCWDTSILLNDIIAASLARNLHLLLRLPKPWHDAAWIDLGWRIGRLAGRNPAGLLSIYNHTGKAMREMRERYRMIFDCCVIGSRSTGKSLNLRQAYGSYLDTWKPAVYDPSPVELGNKANRRKNPRLVQIRGYHFAFMMGFLAQVDPALGGFRGKLSANLAIK